MPRLKIALHGPLLIAGGQASALGVDLATAQRFDGKEWVPYIPATAVRGAVRIQLEALLAGAARPCAGPYVLEETGTTADDHDDVVARLFGFSGPRGSRSGAKPGCLRFGDAVAVDSTRARQALQVRPGLEIEDVTATAADQKLFFREVAEVSSDPLLFEVDLETGGAPEDDLDFLRAAIETTDAIGAGKSKGGGFVAIEWVEDERRPEMRIEGDPSQAKRAKLTLTLTEPAHFGDGGPQGNHQGTRSFIPGATVRGAIAWALLRDGVDAAAPDFQRLFVEQPASFGDALPGLNPTIHPATARQRRGGRKEIQDNLVTELARERINAKLAASGLYLRADDGDARFDPAPNRPVQELVRRTRTRVSIDRTTGTAADGRLFSIEQIEPWLADGTPVVFTSWVEGLDASGAALLQRAAGLPILIGAGRNHGMGKTQMAVRFEGEEMGDVETWLTELTDLMDQEAALLAARAGLPWSSQEKGNGLLVLVAQSDFVPTQPSHHPLAEPELADVGQLPAEPVRCFLSLGTAGGYDQRDKGNLKDLVPALGAGSVFVYEIATPGVPDWLHPLLTRLRQGVGSRVESGCGRFTLFEPTAEE
jgi:CRISPR-associated Csx10 family RAMP protein